MRRPRVWAVLVVAAGVVALGLVSELAAYGPDGYVPAWLRTTYGPLLDLVTGYVFLAAGAMVTLRRPTSLVGPLFVLTAAAWFLGTLIEPSRFIGTQLAPSVVFLYRGPLLHAIVTFPTGRPAGLIEWVAVIGGYAAALVAPLWFDPIVSLVLLGLVTGVAFRAYRHASERARPARREALAMALLLWGTGAVIAAGGATDLPYPFDDAMRTAFHLALMTVPLRLTQRLLRSDRTELTDRVVELAGGSTASLSGELSRLLGDPSLRVGVWDPGAQVYLDEAEVPVSLPVPGGDQVATRIDRDGRELAVVLHASGTIDEAELREAVIDAVRLAAANTRLRAEVEAQVDELTASRRRLVLAADAEGERLAERLRDGAMRRLEAVGGHLDAAAVSVAGTGATTAAVERARMRLTRVTDDLHRFAMGLDPRPLSEGGLAAALAELARDCPIPVDLDVDMVEPSREASRVTYLVCAEALANATKHARASSVQVRLTAASGVLRLTVADDGVGGAVLGGGHGLRNQADRVTSLGGSFSLRSPVGGGTSIEVSLPVVVEIHSSDVTIPVVTTDAAPSSGP